MRRKLIATFVLVIIVLVGCKQVINLNDVDITTESVIKYLASDSLKGRLVGTDGNKKAEKFIESAYKKIGLKPYHENNYQDTYEQSINIPEKQKYNMSFEYSTGETLQLVYGKDFLEGRPTGNFNIRAPITFDKADTDFESKIIILNSTTDLHHKNSENAKAILVKKDLFKKVIVQSENKVPTIQISNEIYDILNSNKDVIVSIDFSNTTEILSANNVIGKIPGENNEEAVIISAHFDHIGWSGDEIYYGAIDNASGISALFNIATDLNNYVNKNGFNKDIIFAAFNGEESGMQGSISFVNKIKAKYKQIYNINIDCLGNKDGGHLIIASGDNCNLVDTIHTFFDSKEYNDIEIFDSNYQSDYISFLNADIPVISIGQANIDSVHTINDTHDKIDIDYIEKVSNDIAEFIISNENTQFTLEANKTTKNTLNNKTLYELSKLKDEDIQVEVLPGEIVTSTPIPENYISEEIILQDYVTHVVYNKENNEDLQIYIEFMKKENSSFLRLIKPDHNHYDNSKLVLYGVSKWTFDSKDEIIQYLSNVDLKAIIEMFSRL